MEIRAPVSSDVGVCTMERYRSVQVRVARRNMCASKDEGYALALMPVQWWQDN
jgi:hypothetical protein